MRKKIWIDLRKDLMEGFVNETKILDTGCGPGGCSCILI
jgi:hypothetical protein